jgi:two-component system sensor histidine kinase CiaH
MFRSATFKLTVSFLALTMTISLMFSIVVYRLASKDITRGIHLQSERIYNQFPVFRDNPILSPQNDIDNGVHTLLLRLVLLNLVVLILAGIVSYLLAKITLRPIEEAHEQQKRFTADVSHELRTPLTALRIESEVALLNDDASNKDLQDTIKSNLEEVSKLENLINNLLKLTRLEISELRQNFEAISIKKVADDAAEQLARLAANRKIKIETTLINKIMYGDFASISQMLVIFLDNAIKYSAAGTTIKLSARTKHQGIIFVVEDEGVGIPKGSLSHIFDRFYRANSSRTKSIDNDGHGLGLSIAKTIADIHEAVITVSSLVGKGTKVEVYFPVDPNDLAKVIDKDK